MFLQCKPYFDTIYSFLGRLWENQTKVLSIASKFLELSDPLILIFVSSFGL